MSAKYLLDTNAVVDLLRGSDSVRLKMKEVGIDRIAIADLTIYELYCGAYFSNDKEANLSIINQLIQNIAITPSSYAYEEAAHQKHSLKKKGELIEDIDILIGSTAIVEGRILVTGNVNHMNRLEGIMLEDWS